ncbi:hypothetical protein HLH33_17785 [Gluconacetobacter diazotrophicus]|uniref:Uncharacterized protein n=1 Tax=Gluconacetobacter diazotrophicus TaxID=33996 RepID=A0A7W4I889_GLUDI|nr:hypothetical protein [Gluconacetobacter diazotrophicus]MBB2158124.1 hypothetical protein [Gluconacetobacter diazotrophicus]
MTSTFETISGTWFSVDGFQIESADLTIELDNGTPYDPELRKSFGNRAAIAIDAIGDMRLWAEAYFSPNKGELARVGLA